MKYLSLLLLLLMLSCEIDYSMGSPSENSEIIPDMVMNDVFQIDVQQKKIIRIEAEKVEIYSETNENRFTNVGFREFNRDDEILRQGQAESIIQYSNEDISMKGNIHVEDIKEKAIIEAGVLYWDEDGKSLTGSDEDQVSIEVEDQGSIKGVGFSADLNTQEVHIKSSVSGTLKEES